MILLLLLLYEKYLRRAYKLHFSKVNAKHQTMLARIRINDTIHLQTNTKNDRIKIKTEFIYDTYNNK